VKKKNYRRKSHGSSRAQFVSRSATDKSEDVDHLASRTSALLSKSASCDRNSIINAVGDSQSVNADGQRHTARTKMEVQENSVALPVDVKQHICTETSTESRSTQASFSAQRPSSRLFQLSLRDTIQNSETQMMHESSSQSEDGSSERRSKRCKLSTYGSDSRPEVKQSRAVSSDTAAGVPEMSKVMHESSNGYTDAVLALNAQPYSLRSTKDCYKLHSCDSSSWPHPKKASVAAHKKKKSVAENGTSRDSEMNWNHSEKKGDEIKLFELTQKSSTYKHRGNSAKMKTEVDTRKQGNSCGENANQTSRNLLHSEPDQKLSHSSTSRGRFKGSAQGKAKSSAENQCHLVHDENLHGNSRSQSYGSWRSSISDVKEHDDCHHAAYADGVGAQRQGKELGQMRPGRRGKSREHSTRTVVDVEHSSIKNSCEDWEAELFIIPSSGCSVIVASDSIDNSVKELFVGESVEVSTCDSYVPFDDGSMVSDSNITEPLLIPTAGSEEEVPDRPLQQDDASINYDDIQNSLSSSVKIGSNCAGEPTMSEPYAYVSYYSGTDDKGEKLSVLLPADLASNLSSGDAQPYKDEYNTSYEVVEPDEFETDGCFLHPSSEECADEMSNGKQLFYYFASD